RQDQAALGIEVADVAGPVPAVRREGLGGLVRRLPVALEQGRTLELDLAVSGDPHRDALGRAADRAEPVILEGRARAGTGLGRAVALEDDHAEVLPGLLDGRRQEGARRDEEPEVAAELAVDRPEDQAPQAERQPTGDRSKPIECLAPAGLVD